MKRKPLFVTLAAALLAAAAGRAQSANTGGMQFEHHTTWAEVKAKAKKENKYIFVDAFTTWCGPCKQMAKNIFPLPEVGAFYNANYINLKVQLDTTKNDDEEVKKWYKDAHDIMVNYNVKVFPTYLFLSPDGKLVHRAVGASMAPEFITKGENALDPDKQYYTLKARYEGGDHSEKLLKNLTMAAMEAYDNENMSIYSKAYFATQKNLLTEENIRMLENFSNSSSDTGFVLMMKYPEAFNKVMGNGFAEKTTRFVIMREELFPALRRGGEIDWAALDQKVVKKYPAREDVAAYCKLFYYQQTGNWDSFAPAAVAFMKKYGATVPAADLNSIAWAIFQHCADMNCIEEAVNWSKTAATQTNDPNYYDTYASLVYKSGKRNEAIAIQEQAIALAKAKEDGNLKELESTLEKMKKGEKTW